MTTTVPTAAAVFRAVDAMDGAVLGGLLADDARMVFGNGEPIIGRDAIMAAQNAFMVSIAGIRHTIRNEWTVGRDTIVETDVTYARHDGTDVTLPVVSIWQTNDDGLLADYRVFLDLAPVFT
ncbi:nuclear transport factor 2 family protein [Pseudonocardia sp. TRM90224]|uniref:nuclear transport factor 2 family protein n=1 Tax=Pseudonocardia sp. TRM90224 TaxID=2812678 RepID=UPI001E5C515B|nr:nuclear transport factor 2 family protein [Pseudonocardia sp. TRM90224]